MHIIAVINLKGKQSKQKQTIDVLLTLADVCVQHSFYFIIEITGLSSLQQHFFIVLMPLHLTMTEERLPMSMVSPWQQVAGFCQNGMEDFEFSISGPPKKRW